MVKIFRCRTPGQKSQIFWWYSGGKERVPAHLVDTAKLEINVEVLLVERLHARVHQATQERRFDLLDDFRAGLGGVMQRRQRTQPTRSSVTLRFRTAQEFVSPEIVQAVFFAQLVVAARDEAQLVRRDAERGEDGVQEFRVVRDPVCDGFVR
jgi:hypothetical protein